MKVVLISILMLVGVQLVSPVEHTPVDIAIQCIKEYGLFELFTPGRGPYYRTEENLRIQLLLATNACIAFEVKRERWCQDQVRFNVLLNVEEDEKTVQEAGGLAECTKNMRDCGKRFVAKIKTLKEPLPIPDTPAFRTRQILDDSE